MTPDERVAAYILGQFRDTDYGLGMGEAERDSYKHLRGCPSTVASVVSQEDGTCGSDTCDVFTVDSVMRCDHGKTWEYFYEESGSVAELMDALAREDAP